MVLTATKARKDQSGVLPKRMPSIEADNSCCTPDVYGIIISIFMQDAPFLVLRLMLIFHYGVVSYTNMFFTCKNTLVIALLIYRLIVVQMERKEAVKQKSNYVNMSESNSHTRLMNNVYHNDPTFNNCVKSDVKLREPIEDPEEPAVAYVIRRHVSYDSLGRISSFMVASKEPRNDCH